MNIAITGYGKMGRVLEQAAAESGVGVSVIAGRTPADDVYAGLLSAAGTFDCIIDFSHHTLTGRVLQAACELRRPAVVCTTGLDEATRRQLHEAAEIIPVVYSQNMSAGIRAVADAVRTLSAALGSTFDVEIVEKHHRLKEDAPSGTALLLHAAVNDGATGSEAVYGRHGMRRRQPGEVGIHAVRGGSIVGEHTVIFAGNDEIIEIKHTALSKRIFADGALRAATFALTQTHGLFGMGEVLGNL